MVAPMETDLMLAEANKLDVDVLCWGGTHRFDAYEYENKFFVNPGSATGAFTSGWMGEGEELVPSFCLMDVSCPNVRGKIYADVLLPGSRYWFDPLCLPIEERRKWSGECER